MTRRPWIISRTAFGALLAGLVVYVLVAEVFHLYPLGPRTPSQSLLDHRLHECVLFWMLACTVVGWVQYFRKRRPPRSAAVWPILLVPLAMGVWLAAGAAWTGYVDYCERVGRRIPAVSFAIDVGLPLGIVAVHLIAGGMAAFFLFTQAVVWRLPSRPGICPVCSYNLTGNVSGVCPECGTPIVTDLSIPRGFYKRTYWWTPELALFPDAKARPDAHRAALREYGGTAWGWVWGLATVLWAFSFVPPVTGRLGGYVWFVRVALLPVIGLELWKARRGIRQSLRRQLRARGQCARCGVAVAGNVSGVCPECGAPVEPKRDGA